MNCLTAFVLASMMAPVPTDVVRPQENKPLPLWAGISSNHAIFGGKPSSQGIMLTFELYNETDKAIDPLITQSELLVNGEPLKEWAGYRSGPRDARFSNLPPKEVLTFGQTFSKHFGKPGIYKLRWRSKMFESPEVTIRVVEP